MRLSDATLNIRPRSAWEALDLGILLARRQAGLLMLSWALLTLPVFALLSLVFWEYPSLSLFLFWWLKPLYERLPLFILSRSLFGDTPTLPRSFKALPRLLRSQWFASLTWRRCSLNRSFDLPVLLLEQLSGSARRQRLRILRQRDTRAAPWLTIVGVHLETSLWLGSLALLYLLIPPQLIADWTWQDLLVADSDWLWFEHLSNLLYALILVIWGPIYVASGFSLYLNRRTILEAWDIELTFRRMQERLKPFLPALLLGVGLLLAPATDNANAAAATDVKIEAPDPESERLLNQPLTSKAASERITKLLDQPPFRNRETVTRWRFEDPQANAEPGWLEHLLNRLLRGGNLQQTFEHVATAVETVLWTALFGLIALALWRYREWLQVHVGRLRPAAVSPRPNLPAKLFGFDVLPETLPKDIVGEVERLWDKQPREALGLLYRALLSHLLHERKLPLKAAHTEGDVLELLRQERQPELTHFAETLTAHWLDVAYGHRVPPKSAKNELCDRWHGLFGSGIPS